MRVHRLPLLGLSAAAAAADGAADDAVSAAAVVALSSAPAGAVSAVLSCVPHRGTRADWRRLILDLR